MKKFILGKKIKMSQIFDEKGNVVPATLVSAEPAVITDIKTKEKDGYEAVQIGLDKLKDKKIRKSQKQKPFKHLKEFCNDINISNYKLGDEINVSVFQEGDNVEISGITKGKGFQGVVKRHGFHGGSRTHGQKHSEREPGSIGTTAEQRVRKGRRMPGRMGGKRVTMKNLEIVKINKDKNELWIAGAVPGRKGTLLEIRSMK